VLRRPATAGLLAMTAKDFFRILLKLKEVPGKSSLFFLKLLRPLCRSKQKAIVMSGSLF
jgi:hypothetical protein